jgi:hypothetical protein
VNLNDLGGDGDLDVQFTGFGVNAGNATSMAQLAKYQFGTTEIPIVRHAFLFNSGRVLTLRTVTTTLNVFSDPSGSGNFVPVSALIGLGEASVRIGVIPEPATLSLLSISLVALTARRTRCA